MKINEIFNAVISKIGKNHPSVMVITSWIDSAGNEIRPRFHARYPASPLYARADEVAASAAEIAVYDSYGRYTGSIIVLDSGVIPESYKNDGKRSFLPFIPKTATVVIRG